MTCTSKRLAILSDLHIGNENTDMSLIRHNIFKCKSKRINEIWLGGDLIEYVNKYAVGKQTIPIDKQIEIIIKLLDPIRHKITKIIYGNHEERAMRNRDIEPTRVIALELGLKDVYIASNKDAGIIHNFKYYIEHPLRDRGNTLAYFHRLDEKLMRNHNAEVFIIPHFHTLFTEIIHTLDIDLKTRLNSYFVYGGGYVDYWNSFGHDIHAQPSELGSRVIKFDWLNHKIKVEML